MRYTAIFVSLLLVSGFLMSGSILAQSESTALSADDDIVLETLFQEQAPAPDLSGQAANADLEYLSSCLWPEPSDIWVEQNLAYCSFTNGLMILNVSDVVQPDTLSTLFLSAPSGSLAQLFKSGDYVYFANGPAGLYVIDVTDPTNPSLAGRRYARDHANGVWVSDTLAYMADGDSGIVILKVRNPASPVQLGRYQTPGRATSIVVQGDLAFASCNYGGLEIIDVGDLTNPTQITHWPTTKVINDVAVNDTLLYVPHIESYGTSIMEILNIADPAAPVVLGSYEKVGVWDRDIILNDTVVFFLGDIVNVSIPASPVKIGEFTSSSRPFYGLSLEGTLLFGASHRDLVIYDVSDLSAPSVVGLYDYADRLHSDNVVLKDTLAFVATPSVVWILNVSNPLEPTVAAVYRDDGGGSRGRFTTGLAVQDNLLFYNDLILDVSDPASVTLLGNTHECNDIFVLDTLAFLTDYNDGLLIYSIGDPSQPDSISNFAQSEARMCDVFVKDDIAYVGTTSDGMSILDVGNPAEPVLLATHGAWAVNDIFVRDSLAYLAAGEYDLMIVNVSNPSLPEMLYVYNAIGDPAHGIDVMDNMILLARRYGGVLVLDITDPVDAFGLDSYSTPHSVEKVKAQDSIVYVVDGDSFILLKNPFLGRKPDLIISSLEITSFTPRIDYSYTIMNIGEAPANLDGPTEAAHDNVKIQGFVSPDTVFGNTGDIPVGGTIIGQSPLGYLDPGEAFIGSFYVGPELPPNPPPYLTLKVDWGSVVDESDETNNTAWTLLALPVTDVHFDIKPGSCPNPLNLNQNAYNSEGVLPVAILGTEEFDVGDIDPATVSIVGVPPLRWSYEDVSAPVEDSDDSCACSEDGPDGFVDLTLKFRRGEIIDSLLTIPLEDFMVLTIEGELSDGNSFEGNDCIKILNWDKGQAGAVRVDGNACQFGFTGNSPNPFNPMTRISFGLPQASDVRLEIYNIIGRRVATLVSGRLEAGPHTVIWDGTGNASGIYFCRLKADRLVETMKMILIK
ncbi:MAG: T9SS type A sorting domain-containing protein [Candidatus Zixiibacteriota bacterium]|nr:MAG: T9SS type A sorting domain-containing protein [candidate division Zixibacteria bacterium]